MAKRIDLTQVSEADLLGLKICDLPLTIEDSWLGTCVRKLYNELERKGIQFKPPCYLADEWLTPDGEPVVGIAFFLAHPVLMKLERKMMLDIEGGTREWCMKLLRHEAGHAINYAYKLYRRKRWRKVFGRFSQQYSDTYRFRPYSKSFVKHLEDYYAQYHPDEDFAETFAVWLKPHSDWENQYRGWKALRKLQYVDILMQEIKDKHPFKKDGKKYWRVPSLKITLKNYYKKKRQFYAEDFPDFHDSNLKRIFIVREKKYKNMPFASDLIKKYKKNIVESVSIWTGEKKYIINDLLETIIDRCRDLKLIFTGQEETAMLEISTYITTLIMNYIHTGRFRRKK
ncbi:MAG: hypothetical protein JSW40_07330 [Candidatus Omnitrophota bacterium]|nr:MAG: hypothetical protein JSW40_07330 [Candidatus Omnitrophota bacterium]